MFISLSFLQKWPKWADKASLLTASGMLLHAFRQCLEVHFVNFSKTVFTNKVD